MFADWFADPTVDVDQSFPAPEFLLLASLSMSDAFVYKSRFDWSPPALAMAVISASDFGVIWEPFVPNANGVPRKSVIE